MRISSKMEMQRFYHIKALWVFLFFAILLIGSLCRSEIMNATGSIFRASFYCGVLELLFENVESFFCSTIQRLSSSRNSGREMLGRTLVL